MNGIYAVGSIIAEIGIAIADEDVASKDISLPIDKQIELLEDLIANAGRTIPPKIAEYLYEALHDSQPLSDADKQAQINKADTIRRPHRVADLTRREFAASVEDWERLAIAHDAPALANELPLDARQKFQRAQHYVLCNDSIAGPIIEKHCRRLIDYAKNKRWGRATNQSLAHLEHGVSTDSTKDRTISDRKWNALIQLTSEFSKRKINVSQFIDADDDAILNERIKSISVIELAYALDNIFPPDEVIGMFIDLGLCQLNTMAYIWRIRERIDQLSNRRYISDDAAPVLTERMDLTPGEFADMLFRSLTRNKLAGKYSQRDLIKICQSAGKNGKLLLHIPKGDLWCAQIAYRIAEQLGQAEPLFKVCNGRTGDRKDRELTKGNMERTLRRKENAAKVPPHNVRAFLEEISRVTVVSTK